MERVLVGGSEQQSRRANRDTEGNSRQRERGGCGGGDADRAVVTDFGQLSAGRTVASIGRTVQVRLCANIITVLRSVVRLEAYSAPGQPGEG